MWSVRVMSALFVLPFYQWTPPIVGSEQTRTDSCFRIHIMDAVKMVCIPVYAGYSP